VGKCHPMAPNATRCTGEPLQEPPRFPWMVAMTFSVIGVPDTLAAAGAFVMSAGLGRSALPTCCFVYPMMQVPEGCSWEGQDCLH
jgi:hypothetical protein